MTFEFLPDIPSDYIGQVYLISGKESAHLRGQSFLSIKEDHHQHVFEIRFNFYHNPFEQAIIVDHLLAVGYGGYFFLYNCDLNENILRLDLNGYFGKIYLFNDQFYVVDAGCLHCIDKTGNIIWQNLNLGVDGVIVERIDDEIIHGSGQWDPPDGWEDFKLNTKTGEIIGN